MAAKKDVKLIGAPPSPYVNRVQFALNLKSVDYEFLIEKFGAKSELLLKSNPVYKKIPVLIHADKPICESLVIIQYIDEEWSDGPSILPSDPYERANARFWAAYIDDAWFPLFKELKSAKEEESRRALREKILQGATLLEDAFVKCSKGKGFFGGETIGYVDIVLGCFLAWVKAGEETNNLKVFDETKTPALAGWIERFMSHNAVKGVMLEPEELINIFKAYQAKAAAAAAASQ